MSLGYAEKLSYKEDVGTVGMSEIFDSPQILQQKIEELTSLIQQSKFIVAFTGAGISTSCGIPDFRGPKGVWTLQRAGERIPEASLPFDRAMPSLTHMALVELERAGILKFVISQNIDSLHLRSGIPREKLSELHGNSFREVCRSCGNEYLRDFEVETIGMKVTSRRCSDPNCNAKLRDSVLDWEDALPTEEIIPAEKNCKIADLVLCLGTSLQITPACNLPFRCIRNGGKVVIVNLQPTPKDKKAHLVIHGLVDKVMTGVMQLLNLRIPPSIRIDFLQLIFSHSPRNDICMKWILSVSSIHGPRAPLPFLKSIEIAFPDRPEFKTALLLKQPFRLRRETARSRPIKMVITFHFSDGCACPSTSIEWQADFEDEEKSFVRDKNEVVSELQNAAIADSQCGQHAYLERKVQPNSYVTTTAIVTNIRRYAEAKGPGKISPSTNIISATKRPNGNIDVNGTSIKKLRW